MKLFEQALYGKTELKNRIIMSAMVTNYANSDGTPSERLTRYHEERAKGGVGLVTVEAAYVSRFGRAFPTQAGLYDDSLVPAWTEFCDRIHACGAKVSVQLHHAGRQTTSFGSGMPYIEASTAIPCPVMQEMPVAMTVERIKEVVQEYAAAARRAKEAGFDVVEIHGGHGYLINNFQSPHSNKRTDEYGGCAENRNRMPLEVVRAVREAVGEDFTVAYKLSAVDDVEGGLTIEDTCAFAKELVANGVDAIVCSRAVYASINMQTPSPAAGYGVNIENASMIKKAIDSAVPVAVVGMIKEYELAEKTLEEGKADFIVMGRPLICDPELPNKMKEGRFEDIRTCLSCNQGCVGKLLGGGPVECMINTLAGNEYAYDLSEAADKKQVVVIGSGPAGLEAARIAAIKGHDVTLYEKDRLGGQLNEAAVPPYKKEIKMYLDLQVRTLNKLGVNIVMEEATAEKIKDMNADEVIVATGSHPVMIPVAGSETNCVVSARDVLNGAEIGNSIAVIGGGLVGCETAEFLLTQGKKVTIIEMLGDMARDMAGAPKEFMFRYFATKADDLTIMCSTKLKEIGPDYVIVEKDNADQKIENIDTIAMAVGAKANKELIADLEAAGIECKLVGDCVQARQIIQAVEEGFKAAIEV